MAVRRMSSIIAVLMVIAIACFVVLCSMCRVDAMVNPSPEEENAKTVAASSSSNQTDTGSGSSSSKTKKKTQDSTEAGSNSSSSGNSSQSGSNNNSGNDSDDDEDVLDENAFSTPGNASLGDVVRNSDSKDFYTIKTENDNTFYLVIDHAGSYDNVYMLSTIDENDLKEFLEDEDTESGSLILPETNTNEETESKVETPEKEPEKNKLPGIISLVLIIAAAIAGVVIYRRYRQGNAEPEEDYSENMEDDGIPTVNEDEEFLE